jgi:hypothetical protein
MQSALSFAFPQALLPSFFHSSFPLISSLNPGSDKRPIPFSQLSSNPKKFSTLGQKFSYFIEKLLPFFTNFLYLVW